MMDWDVVARALHVVAVVAWIGGVGFVTTVVAPVIRRTNEPQARMAAFLRFEDGFVWQARASVFLAGLSGFYMVERYSLWDRFKSPSYWWMHAMVGLWLLFAVMLFLIEPLVLDRKWQRAAQSDPQGATFARIERMHRLLFALSLIVVFSAVGGAHGLL